MADYTDFTRLVSNFAPNVPPFVVARAAQQCTQDFFGRTTEFQEEIIVNTIAGQRAYVLTPNTSDTFVNLVLSVTDANGNAVNYCQHADTLTLNPIPQTEQDLAVVIALCPTVEAIDIPDSLYFRHSLPFRNGILAILKAQVGTEWYSPVEAVNYQRIFEQDITQSKILALTKNNATTMQIPSFN
jgi:hypothetical protein